MQQIVLAIAATLAMLFNVFGVPGTSRTTTAPGNHAVPPEVVMMVADGILRTG